MKDLVQVRKYGDVINTDMTVEAAVSAHGPENVLVNGVAVSDLPKAEPKAAKPKKGGKDGDDNA